MSEAQSKIDATSSATGEPVAVGAQAAPRVAPRRSAASAVRHVAGRIAYWTPVLAALGLFAQVAFLGLRPALSEGRRLADASDMLGARWSQDRGLYDAYEMQLQARQDPIFLERQSRMRRAKFVPAPASTSAASATAGPSDTPTGT